MDQESTETPLPQGEQEAGSQSPHERRPGPQNHLPGHRAGGEPCSQRRQGHGQEHQGADERAGLQPDQPPQSRQPGQDGQQRGDASRIAVSGGDPGAPGGVPHLAPAAAEQGQGPTGDGAGEQQPGQAVGAQRQHQHHDSAQGATPAAGQCSELTQLELAGGCRSGTTLTLLAGAVAAHPADLGRRGVETPQRGCGHTGVSGEPPPGRPDPSTASGHGQSRTELITGQRRRLGGEAPHGPHQSENDEPGQQQADGPG